MTHHVLKYYHRDIYTDSGAPPHIWTTYVTEQAGGKKYRGERWQIRRVKQHWVYGRGVWNTVETQPWLSETLWNSYHFYSTICRGVCNSIRNFSNPIALPPNLSKHTHTHKRARISLFICLRFASNFKLFYLTRVIWCTIKLHILFKNALIFSEIYCCRDN